MNWTQEVKSLVAGMLLEKLSARQIAARLAPDIVVSKNAVIGVVDRDDVLRGIGFATTNPRAARSMASQRRHVKPVAQARAPRLAAPRSVPLLELKRGDCKWAVNDPPPKGIHLFCGNPSEPDKPYCPGHMWRSYRRPEVAQ